MAGQNLFAGAPGSFIRRSDFGKDFIFGSATAAFQIEGCPDKGGRGLSIWDTFAKEKNYFHPYHENAVNHYENFEEDVRLIKEIGFDAYRFSISWPRICPTGKKESRNQEGIDFYKKLLKKLKDNGIVPFVTLFHWDLPQALQDEYNGFFDRRVADDFADYADICFKEFGEYVEHWITMNEPFTYSYSAHVTDVHAPGFGTVQDGLFATGTTSDKVKTGTTDPKTTTKVNGDEKNSTAKKPTAHSSKGEKMDEFKYPYIVTHNQLLAHAKAVKVFRDKYQDPAKKKMIGITLVSMWFEPRNPQDEKDKAAALRAVDFFLGWFLAPLVKGDYPESMRKHVKKEHLPEMGADKQIIQGTYDFIGMNYYTGRYVGHFEYEKTQGSNYVTDQCLKYYETRRMEDGEEIPIGHDRGGSAWLIAYPKGMEQLLLYMKQYYGNPLIYITENGIDDHDDNCGRLWNSYVDHKRISYMHDHLSYLLEAKRQGVNVKGYFAWSLLDNFEWNNGFHVRFGLIYVNYKNQSRRHPKLSATWLKNFLAS